MNENNIHKPYNLLYDNNDTIIIMIHGILGSPYQFNKFSRALYEKNYSVATVLLGHHGCNGKDFSKGHIASWEKPIIKAIEKYQKTYKNIYLMGHSMGCLLSIQQSLNYNIKGLILLAPPIYVKLSLRHFQISCCMHFEKFKNNNPNLKMYKEYSKAYSVTDVNFLDYLKWGKPLYNLFKLIKLTRKALPKIKTNTLIFQSTNDETVHYKSGYIFENEMTNCETKLVLLKNSTHSYYKKNEREIIMDNIFEFIEQNNKNT